MLRCLPGRCSDRDRLQLAISPGSLSLARLWQKQSPSGHKVELGAAWQKRSEQTDRDYLSVKLESGRRGPFPGRAPLRTARASFPACSSSLC
jgi:hypothetical protein